MDTSDEAIERYVAAALPLLGVAIAPEWRATVHANLAAILRAAAFAAELPLDDESEPAPVFEA